MRSDASHTCYLYTLEKKKRVSEEKIGWALRPEHEIFQGHEKLDHHPSSFFFLEGGGTLCPE